MYSVAFFLPSSAPRTGPYLKIPDEEGNLPSNENNTMEEEQEIDREKEITMDELMAGYNDDAPKPSLIQQVLPMATDLNEFEESDSEGEHQIEASDEVVVLCHIKDEVANCEVCIFDTQSYNLYTHHDMCVGELSTCMSYMNQNPLEQNETNKIFCAIGHMNGEISIWDLMIVNVPGPSVVLGGQDEQGRTRPDSHTDCILSLDWNPHSNLLASGSADGTVKIWNVLDQSCVSTIEFGDLPTTEDEEGVIVQSIQWHPREPQLLLVASSTKIVRVFDTTNPESVLTFQAESCSECVRWNNLNPACFFVGTENGYIESFDVRRAGQPALFSQQLHENSISDIIINNKRPDIIATGGDDEHIRLWKLKGSGFDVMAEKHMGIGAIMTLGWGSTEHSSLIVTGGTENVAVWDTKEVPQIKTLLGL